LERIVGIIDKGASNGAGALGNGTRIGPINENDAKDSIRFPDEGLDLTGPRQLRHGQDFVAK
jgi:hypothetical protein